MQLDVVRQLAPVTGKVITLTTIVLRLKEIRYCSIVARGSPKTLVYHSLPKY